jgi:carbamoyltransferase
MAYNVLGIHPGHNGAAALVSDGELVYYLEEERLSRSKRDGNPFRAMIDICSKYKIDELVIGGTMIKENLIYYPGLMKVHILL